MKLIKTLLLLIVLVTGLSFRITHAQTLAQQTMDAKHADKSADELLDDIKTKLIKNPTAKTKPGLLKEIFDLEVQNEKTKTRLREMTRDLDEIK